MEEQDIFYFKYVKYKTKYDNLKKLLGGNNYRGKTRKQYTPYNYGQTYGQEEKENRNQNINENINENTNNAKNLNKMIRTIYSGEKDEGTLTECVLQRCKDEGKKIYSDHAMIHYKVDDIDVRTWNISDQISANNYGSVDNPSFGHKFKLENNQPYQESAEYNLRLEDIANKIKPYILQGGIILLQEGPSWFPSDDNFIKQIKTLGKNIIVEKTESNYVILNGDTYSDIKRIELVTLNLQKYDSRILKRPPVIVKMNKGSKKYIFVSVHIGYIAEDINKDRNIESLKTSLEEIIRKIHFMFPLSVIVFGGDFNRSPTFLTKMLEIPDSKFYTSTKEEQQTSYRDNKGNFNQENVDLLFVVR